MSINAVLGVSSASSQPTAAVGITAIPPATSFDQELNAQGGKAGAAHGHHHGGGSQSVTTSAASAASAVGASLPSTIAATLHRLLG